MDIYGQIAQAIRGIAGSRVSSATIFPAEVKSVSGATCSILIGSLELSDVRLLPNIDMGFVASTFSFPK